MRCSVVARARATALGSALGAMAMAIAIAVASPASAANGANGAINTRRPIAVSVPSEPVALAAGNTGIVPIRVVNPGPAVVTVRIAGRGVRFGNDGRVTMADLDAWDHRVEFPARPIAIAARSYREVRLRVRMPARIDPDLYFIGFTVTPVATVTANLTYVNQIGSYITIDVPGPRTRLLTAELQLPGFVLTGGAHGTLRVHNAGRAAAFFWGEYATTVGRGSATSEARIERSLLPRGRYRTISVEAKSSFPIAFATVHVHIFYPGRSDASTREVTLTRTVLIVQPVALVALVLAGCIAVTWFVRRVRRRRRTRRTRSRPKRAQAPRVAARVDRQLERVRANAISAGRS